MSLLQYCCDVLYVFVRLMSQVADVNTQSSIGMFHFMMSYIALSSCFIISTNEVVEVM